MRRSFYLHFALLAVFCAIQTPASADDYCGCTSSACCQCETYPQFIPQWAKRIDVGVEMQTIGAPSWYIETIQPVYQTPCCLTHTVYLEGKLAEVSSKGRLVAGGGYRYLFDSKCVLLGANGMYDLVFDDCCGGDHRQRASGGLEVFFPYVFLNGNFYFSWVGGGPLVCGRKLNGPEGALHGWDAYATVPVPYLPWATATGSFYHWDGRYKDVNGFGISAWGHLCDFASVEAGWRHDDRDDQWFLRIELHPGRPFRIEHTLWCEPYSSRPWTPFNPCDHTLEKVQRFG